MPKGKKNKLSEEYLDHAVETVLGTLFDYGPTANESQERNLEEALKKTLRELFE